MRFLRSLAGCLATIASAAMAFGQDSNLPQEPLLGTIVVLDLDISDPAAPRLLPAEPELGPIVPLGRTVRVVSGKSRQNRQADHLGFDRRKGVSLVAYSDDDDDEDDDDNDEIVLRIPGDPGHATFLQPQMTLGRERQCPPFVDDDPNPMVNFFPIRVIGQPMPAPTGEPFGFGMPPVGPPVHPDEIQSHLSAAAAQLAMAGLNVEAQRIQEFQQHFQREHSQRLLITFKEFQLRVLQEEIAILKQHQPAPSPYSEIVLEAKAIGVK